MAKTAQKAFFKQTDSVKWLSTGWTARVQFPAGAEHFLFASTVF
jgi:hypothetical protein